jgi:non-specific serine/threonine protein kinase
MQEEISFGTWLRKQRRALDLTRQAFADQIGCAEVTLRRIEAGTLKPSTELASILLEKLRIPEPERPQWISFARGLSAIPAQSIPSPKKPLTNLPAPLTSFIGREKEQAQAIHLIGKHRLVTLTGSGGVGKTRFARKLGEQLLENYSGGVWLVELASLNDPTLVPQTAAMVFGLITDASISYTDLLINFLRTKSVLLILDNCEHLADSCARLAETLLRNCPDLHILVTSRQPLEIAGEALYRVPSLGLPDLHDQLDTLRDCESVRLFEERAQLVQFDFPLTPGNTASVVQICDRLDGIPLAIELAAAKVATFSVEQIAKQLHESFRLLAQGNRTVLPRHQTLRASIDWSWSLLSELEQTLMWQLSVFSGGWTLEAAQSVCDGDVLNLLNSLVSKSLIVINPGMDTSVRYSFHETIRQFAHEKLRDMKGGQAIRDKHLAYSVKLAGQAEPELYRADQVIWLNKLDDELDNLRVALDWALSTNVELGLRLIVSARFFWEARGDMREVEGWLAQLLQNYKEPNALCARALVIYSKILSDRGLFAEAQEIAKQSLEIARAISDKPTEAFSLWGLGASLGYQGNVRQGIPLIKQSLALYQFLGDKLGQATALDWLSMDHNDWERSKAYVIESLKLYRELGHLSGIALCLMDLAEIMIAGGNFSSLDPLLEEALMIYRQLESQAGESNVLMFYGRLAFWQADYSQACSYFEQSILLYEKVGASWSAWSRAHMAYALLRQGEIVQARGTFEISLRQFEKAGYINGLIFTIEGFASWYTNQGQSEYAAQLLGWADMMREKMNDDRPPVEQKSVERDLKLSRSHLDDAAFEAAYQTGRVMTMAQAIALGQEM